MIADTWTFRYSKTGRSIKQRDKVTGELPLSLLHTNRDLTPAGWGLDFWGLAVVYVLFYSVPVALFGGIVGHLLGLLVEAMPSRRRKRGVWDG